MSGESGIASVSRNTETRDVKPLCLSPGFQSTLHHIAFAEHLRSILAAPVVEKRQKKPPKYVAKRRCSYLLSVNHFCSDPGGLKIPNTANVEALAERNSCLLEKETSAASINCSSPRSPHQLTPGNKTKASWRKSSLRYAPLLFACQQGRGHSRFVICHYLFSCSHKQMGNIPPAGSTLQRWPLGIDECIHCGNLCIETEPD